MRLVSLNLPVELISAISRAARDAGKTPQDLLRATLAHVFAADGAGQGRGDPAGWGRAAPRGDGADAPQDPLPASTDTAQGAAPEVSPGAPPFAVHLAFAEAFGWLDLQSRLRAAGFVLRLAQDGTLALHTWPADHRLIDSAAIGQPLADLTLRFRAAFPGQVWEEVLVETGTAAHRKGRAA